MKEELNRWLPPEPHRSAVLREIARGQAHIVERGHNEPPLLIWEDGGEMVLPTVRHVDGSYVSDSSASADRQTVFHDICSNVNRLNELFERGEPLSDEEIAHCMQMLDDMEYMFDRMKRRRARYSEFARKVMKIAKSLEAREKSDYAGAKRNLQRLRKEISGKPGEIPKTGRRLHEIAEKSRDVANHSEDMLRFYRDDAIRLKWLFDDVRGARNWDNPRKPPQKDS
ncbi:MAG TPA: hypothetical protein PL033_10325 [Candidatus Brocadiia bacterium]|nr:hypothetical protein [Candidatus Brocadiia bacterium]